MYGLRRLARTGRVDTIFGSEKDIRDESGRRVITGRMQIIDTYVEAGQKIAQPNARTLRTDDASARGHLLCADDLDNGSVAAEVDTKACCKCSNSFSTAWPIRTTGCKAPFALGRTKVLLRICFASSIVTIVVVPNWTFSGFPAPWKVLSKWACCIMRA